MEEDIERARSLAQDQNDDDLPVVGSVWEDPMNARHYEVESVGAFYVTLRGTHTGRDRHVDVRDWPAQLVLDSQEV